MTYSMSVKLNVSSGSYNVRESELYKDVRSPGRLMRCRVHFLDDSEGNFEIDVRFYYCYFGKFSVKVFVWHVQDSSLCM